MNVFYWYSLSYLYSTLYACVFLWIQYDVKEANVLKTYMLQLVKNEITELQF